MQVNAITSYQYSTPNKLNNHQKQSTQIESNSVNFTAREDNRRNSNAMRNAVVALCFLPVAGGVVTSCDKEAFAEAKVNVDANANANANASIIDTTGYKHPGDTIIKWYYKYQKPIPLDSLFNNMQNWDIDGADGDKNDSTANRNIIHYEGAREWEYNTKEIGDMNILESSRNILVYDTEIKDYKGNHESYGKRIFRVPSGSFTITMKDGKTIHNPKGLFVEEYENETDEKNASIFDCKLKSRAFIQTNGDTLNVARRSGTSEYVERGSASKGYLGANSVLLRNLIGQYSTDDHYVDFKVDAINDKDLRLKYVEAMDNIEGK